MGNYQNPNKQHEYNNLDLVNSFLMGGGGPGGGKPPHPQHNQMLQLGDQPNQQVMYPGQGPQPGHLNSN